MKAKELKMTTSQFAKLHGVNKRTLHYYDKIGLFSPKYKGDNNYRYYVYSQSIDFEYIRMLKELNMSIDEIKEYVHSSKLDEFLHIVEKKLNEIDEEIKKLQKTKEILRKKQKQLLQCKMVTNMRIDIVECKDEYLLTTPFSFEDDNVTQIFHYIHNTWDVEQYRMGVGSYITIEKVRNSMFDEYDGLFTPMQKKGRKNGLMLKEGGSYLCGYVKGSWDQIPNLYNEMFKYADKHQLTLTGFAYEMSQNDFVISNVDDYITQVLIKIENN